jgi:hypothetical protein
MISTLGPNVSDSDMFANLHSSSSYIVLVLISLQAGAEHCPRDTLRFVMLQLYGEEPAAISVVTDTEYLTRLVAATCNSVTWPRCAVDDLRMSENPRHLSYDYNTSYLADIYSHKS